MRSPFKFLDYFEKEDHASFFGREPEKERLYKLVNHHRLSLIYGPSGTGKTSLIRCGLANRFNVTEWLPIFIKRQQDINESLVSALKSRLKEDQELFAETTNPVVLLEEINIQYLRPVYLIFDQLEELYIDGSQEERAVFAGQIKSIIDAGLPCRLIFVLREEYLGRLYEFEQLVPIYYEQRLRVEPLTAPVVKEEVIQKSFTLFNINLSEPGLEDRMLENLSGLKQVIPLPYLQVYLDRLWNAAYEEQTAAVGKKQTQLSITPAIVDKLGTLEDVFASYLLDQQRIIQQTLAERFPACPENFVRSLLDGLVTPEGTKRSVGIQREGTGFAVQAPVPTGWDKADALLMNEGLNSLAAARLLRVEEESVELAHDSLAAVIDGQRSAEERQLNLYRQQIRASFELFSQTDDYLSKNKVPLYEENLADLALPVDQREYLQASKAYWKKIDEAELEQARLVAEEKLVVEREKRRRLRVFSVVAGVLLAAALGTAFVLFGALKKATLLEQTLASDYDELIGQGKKEFAEWNLQNALTYWANARFLKPGNEEAQEFIKIAEMTIEAERLVNAGYWDEAEEKFNQVAISAISNTTPKIRWYLDAIVTSRETWNSNTKYINLAAIDTLSIEGDIISIPRHEAINPRQIALQIVSNLLIVNTFSFNCFPFLQSVSITNSSIEEITPLKHLTQLSRLELIRNDKLIDIAPLKHLTQLSHLELIENDNLVDIAPLKHLTQLSHLELIENDNLVDIAPLKHLTQLSQLVINYSSWSWNSKPKNIIPLQNLAQLTHLELTGFNELVDIAPLKHLTQLSQLVIRENDSLTDFAPLKYLTQLSHLKLIDNDNLIDIAPLKHLTQLTQLELVGNDNLIDIAPLKHLTQLSQLELVVNDNLIDITPLKHLTQLSQLNLSFNNNLTDITPLQYLTQLTQLELVGNDNLIDITPLKHLTQLSQLNLSFNNNLTDITPLQYLTQLTQLELVGNDNLTDITLQNLSKLTHLIIRDNDNLTDITLQNLPQLTQLELRHNPKLIDIAPMQNLPLLTNLIIRYNNGLTDIAPLKHLTQLTRLELSSHPKLIDIAPLKHLTLLTYLNLGFSPVPSFQISALEEALPKLKIVKY